MTEKTCYVYLDQNALSDLAKGKFVVETFRADSHQLIYSHEHIVETANCSNSDLHRSITDTLRKTKAAYLNQGILHFDKHPKQLLDEYISNCSTASHKLLSAMQPISHKFFGGQKDKSFGNLDEAIEVAFSDHLSNLKSLFEQLSEEEKTLFLHQQNTPDIETFVNTMRSERKNNALRLSETLDSNIPPQHNPAQEFRGAYKIDHVSLNKICPPKVLEQIFQQISMTPSAPAFVEPEQLLTGLEESTGQVLTTESRIHVLYNFLAYLGYQADTKLGRRDKFRAAMSDHTHVANAAYAHIFITFEERMARRAFAIYEYLNIATNVCLAKNLPTGALIVLCGRDIFEDNAPT